MGVEKIIVRDAPVDLKPLEDKIDEVKRDIAKIQADVTTIKTDVIEIKER